MTSNHVFNLRCVHTNNLSIKNVERKINFFLRGTETIHKHKMEIKAIIQECIRFYSRLTFASSHHPSTNPYSK